MSFVEVAFFDSGAGLAVGWLKELSESVLGFLAREHLLNLARHVDREERDREVA